MHYEVRKGRQTLPNLERSGQLLTSLSAICISYFILALIAAVLLRPEMNVQVRFVSEYAVGHLGWLTSSALLVVGLGSLSLAFAVRQHLQPSATLIFGVIFLSGWGVGSIIASFFVTDLQGAPRTLHGRLHDAGAVMAFLSATPAAFLISKVLRIQGSRDAVSRWLSFMPWLILAGLLLFFGSFATGSFGLFQRVYLTGMAVWLLLVAWRLR